MPKQIYQSRLNAATDDTYAALMAAHEGLTETQSHALNARLILLMANTIGDADQIRDLCETARAYAD